MTIKKKVARASIRMTAGQLRERFLNFFACRGHKIYPSALLVPKDDPTLLFTSAGMNQFKQEFLGKPTKFRRCVSCQKCLRTDDLDKVGKTNFHHTFFEMLGNFSFGGYFKEEAIALAWEFMIEELGLPKERLWVSVYVDDEESYEVWKNKIKLLPQRIVKLGAEQNFWPANAPEQGPNGPCGPCSEIFYDRGPKSGCARSSCRPGCDCGRFVETWNLVFTQFERKDKNVLVPLPKKNIDTGMGLERMAAVLQGVQSNFEIDSFKPLTEQIVRLSCVSGDKLSSAQYSARNAIADHIRAVTFAIADGVLPSNDERGYVVRKLIRRALWHGRSLVTKKTYLYKMVPTVVGIMKQAYPQLKEKREDIAGVVLAEERRFHRTLKRAVSFAQDMIAALAAQGKTEVPGNLAFKLYDTYGLPLEMLEDLLAEGGFQLDREGFNQQLHLQRELSRKSCVFETTVFAQDLTTKYKLKATKFVGEKFYSIKTKVVALFKNEQPIKLAKANGGGEIKIILQTTPFYGAAGGQVGDTGVLKNKNVRVEIFDTKKIGSTTVHLGKVTSGTIGLHEKVQAQIDAQRRMDITRNHAATHLLQAALREVLGEHIRQAGSWVGPDRLRFDFTHFQALDKLQLARTEKLINQAIAHNVKVEVLKMDFEEAEKRGALAFFGEKYQEQVRVLKIGQISLELCGGTHVSTTGQIKLLKIISETSIASGIRRIEALTGTKAEEFLKQKEEQVKELTQSFSSVKAEAAPELPERIEQLLRRIKQLNRRLQTMRLKSFELEMNKIITQSRKIAGANIIVQQIKSADMNMLRLMADLLRQKISPSAVVLSSVWQEKVVMVCALSTGAKALTKVKGLDASKIIRAAAVCVGGSGGGGANFAQAGGRKPQGLKQALAKAEQIIEEELLKRSQE